MTDTSDTDVAPREVARREGREGSRWVNQRPAAAEVAAWFKENIVLHEGMEHEEWVTGITLIQSTESHDEIRGFTQDGRPIIAPDVQHLFFIPYPKVETRVAYFNALVAKNDSWSGFILPVAAADPKGMHVGYTAVKITRPADGKAVSLIVYTAEVRVFDGEVKWEEQEDADGVMRKYPTGKLVLSGLGTKSVPLTDRHGQVDPNAMAKAQTGAVGRALGMAGVLVIPGTGVATAEDMQESAATGNLPGASLQESANPPDGDGRIEDADPDETLRSRALALIGQLKADHPKALQEFQAWARGRNLGQLSTISGAPLKGVVKKLEKALDDAQASAPPPPDTDLTGEDETL